MDKKLTIAISGANGFIGRAIASRFIEEGQKVAAIPRELLLDMPALGEYFKVLKPNYIFHLASFGNMYDQKEEDEIFSTNVIKTYFLLKASLSTEYSAFINFSSSSVYGEKSMPMNERDCLDTDTLYGATKVGAEYLAKYFANKYEKPIVNVRPFSVTGIGEQSSHLIPTLIRSCLYGEKMKIVKSPTHDFIDIQDLVDGVLHLALNANKFRGNAFNIGTGIYWRNEQVQQMVEAVTGKKAKVRESNSMRGYDSNLWVADPTKLKMLGWFPKKELQTSIEEMVEYEKTREKDIAN